MTPPKLPYLQTQLSKLITFYPIEPLNADQKFMDQLTQAAAQNSIKTAFLNLYENAPAIKEIKAIVGIEVEVENVGKGLIEALKPGWSVINDNSLRNHGKEFLLLPSSPQAARAALCFLFALFNHAGTKPDFSWRTSLHVHLNMREERIEQLLSFLVLYLLFEDAIFSFVGDHRRASNFCVPLQETNASLLIAKMFKATSKLSSIATGWQKYTALNARPLITNDHAGMTDSFHSGKGTVEFRHLEGTQNLSRILGWLNIILALQAASRRYSPDYIEERVTNMGTRADYLALLTEIFGSLLPPPRHFPTVLYSSIAYAKECYCPVPNIAEVVTATIGKETGLAQLIKLRMRRRPTEEPKKKVDVSVTESTPLPAGLSWAGVPLEAFYSEHIMVNTPSQTPSVTVGNAAIDFDSDEG